MAVGLLEERHADPGRGARPGQLRRPVRVHHRPRRHRRGERPGVGARSRTRTRPSGPTVQVGDPFAEKLLIEASLELIERGPGGGHAGPRRRRHHLRRVRDGRQGRHRHRVDLDAIPRREPGMDALGSDDLRVARSACWPRAARRTRGGCRGRLRRWGIPIALVGRVTADGDIAIVEGGIGPDGGPTRVRGDRPHPGRGPDQRRHRLLARLAAPPPGARAGAGARGHPADRAGPACPNAAWTRARCCWRCWAAPTCRAAAGSTSSTTRRVQSQHRRGPATGRRYCGSRAPTRRWSWPRRTAIRPSAPSTRTSARSWRWPRPRATSASPGPGRSASPTASTTANPKRPEAFWQLQEASGAWPRPAGRSSVPVTGGNVSLYNEYPAAPSPRRRRSAS